MVQFLDAHGISTSELKAKALDLTPLELTAHHVIVSLQGPVSSYFENIPFHTTPLEWDIGDPPGSEEGEETSRRLEEVYREIALQVRDLMELLRGEEAP